MHGIQISSRAAYLCTTCKYYLAHRGGNEAACMQDDDHSRNLSLPVFAKLEYEKETFFENVLFNLRVRTIREMSQLDERVNRSLWTATPAVVNAYYSRNRNQISELVMGRFWTGYSLDKI